MKQIKYIAMLPLIFTSLSFASAYQFSTVEEMQYVSLPAFSSIGVKYHLHSEYQGIECKSETAGARLDAQMWGNNDGSYTNATFPITIGLNENHRGDISGKIIITNPNATAADVTCRYLVG